MKRKFLVLGIATAVMAMTSAVSAASLVAHYPLDSFYNTGTYGIPGNITRTPNLVPGWGDATLQYSGGALFNGTISPGLLGNCYEETGTQGRITFGTMDPFAGTGSFTYTLWMYDPFGSPSTGLQSMLLSKQLANNNHYFRVIIRDYDTMQIGAYNAGAQQDRNTSAISPDPSGKWTHIAVTGSKVGSTATWQVYANGNLLSLSGGGTTILDAAKSAIGMTLGQTAGNQNQGYPGLKVDDIRFYDGVLSQSEILAVIAVPEPSAMGLALLGALVVLVRRTRFLG